MSDKPYRAPELELNVSAHTLDELANELRQVADRIDREGLSDSGVCGGSRASHRYSYQYRPDITPGRWRESLKRYLSERRAEASE